MAQLTEKQKATIRRLVTKHPSITPESVNGYYCPSYMYSWFIYIEIPGVSFSTQIQLTRCDHITTANDKGIAFRDYIALLKEEGLNL